MSVVCLRRPQAQLASLEWVASALFVLALVVGMIAPITDLTGWMKPIGALIPAALQTLGVVVAIAGVVATFLAQVAMAASWRIAVDPSERTDHVTEGVLGIVRNPIVSATWVTATRLGLWSRSSSPFSRWSLSSAPSSCRCAAWRSPTCGECTEAHTPSTCAGSVGSSLDSGE